MNKTICLTCMSEYTPFCNHPLCSDARNLQLVSPPFKQVIPGKVFDEALLKGIDMTPYIRGEDV